MFPFAGGSRYSYNAFRSDMPPFINPVPFDLPGRGGRFREHLLEDMDAMAEDLFQQIQPYLKEGTYAIYGHSMGTALAHLVVLRIIEAQKPLPLEIFLTGRGGPDEPETDNWHKLPSSAFREKIKKLGGSPQEVLEDESLMDFIEPILRADFKAIETHTYPAFEPFDIPLTVVTGTNEDISTEGILSWQKITSRPADFRQFPGDHFFIFEHAGALLNIFSGKLQSYAPKMPGISL